MLLHSGQVCRDRLVGNHVKEVVDPEVLADQFEVFTQSLFQAAWHPDDALMTALGGDELAAGDVGFADAEESGRLLSAARHGGQGGKLHARRSLTKILAVDQHY